MDKPIKDRLTSIIVELYLDGCDGNCSKCKLSNEDLCNKLYDLGKEIYDEEGN